MKPSYGIDCLYGEFLPGWLVSCLYMPQLKRVYFPKYKCFLLYNNQYSIHSYSFNLSQRLTLRVMLCQWFPQGNIKKVFFYIFFIVNLNSMSFFLYYSLYHYTSFCPFLFIYSISSLRFFLNMYWKFFCLWSRPMSVSTDMIHSLALDGTKYSEYQGHRKYTYAELLHVSMAWKY